LKSLWADGRSWEVFRIDDLFKILIRRTTLFFAMREKGPIEHVDVGREHPKMNIPRQVGGTAYDRLMESFPEDPLVKGLSPEARHAFEESTYETYRTSVLNCIGFARRRADSAGIYSGRRAGRRARY